MYTHANIKQVFDSVSKKSILVMAGEMVSNTTGEESQGTAATHVPETVQTDVPTALRNLLGDMANSEEAVYIRLNADEDMINHLRDEVSWLSNKLRSLLKRKKHHPRRRGISRLLYQVKLDA